MEKLKSLIDELIDRISNFDFSIFHLDHFHWIGPVLFISIGTLGGRAMFRAFEQADDGRGLWLR